MRIRTLAGPPLEHEIVRDVLRSILLGNASVPGGDRGVIDGDSNVDGGRALERLDQAAAGR